MSMGSGINIPYNHRTRTYWLLVVGFRRELRAYNKRLMRSETCHSHNCPFVSCLFYSLGSLDREWKFEVMIYFAFLDIYSALFGAFFSIGRSNHSGNWYPPQYFFSFKSRYINLSWSWWSSSNIVLGKILSYSWIKKVPWYIISFRNAGGTRTDL